MRKLFLSLFSFSLALLAMAQDGKYTLNIAVPDSIDISEVYLFKIEIGDPLMENIVVDTIKIEGKRASVSGLMSEVKATPIASVKGNGLAEALVVFEEGVLEITLGKESYTKGSLLNERFTAFRKSTSAKENQLRGLGEKFGRSDISDEEKEALAKEAMPLSEELSKSWLDFTKSNMDNSFGQFFAMSFIRSMPADKINELLESAPAEFKSSPLVVARFAEIEAEEAAQGVGLPYKDITLKSPEGENVALSDYVGKNELVLIDFWASWCGPCIKEMPTLVKAYEQFKGKGFEIVGISLDSTREAWLGAINRLKMNWVHMSDLGGWKSSAAELYAIRSIPQTLLVNKEGKIVAANLRGEALILKIESLLNK